MKNDLPTIFSTKRFGHNAVWTGGLSEVNWMMCALSFRVSPIPPYSVCSIVLASTKDRRRRCCMRVFPLTFRPLFQLRHNFQFYSSSCFNRNQPSLRSRTSGWIKVNVKIDWGHNFDWPVITQLSLESFWNASLACWWCLGTTWSLAWSLNTW